MAIFNKVEIGKDRWGTVTEKVPVYLADVNGKYIVNEDGSKIVLDYEYTKKSWDSQDTQATRRSWGKKSVSNAKTNWS